MFAIVKTGGKQYTVAENDVIVVEKLAGEAGSEIKLEDVLLVGAEGKTTVGTPLVKGAAVTAEVLEQGKGDKVIIFKKKRRQNYRRTKGHRQEQTVLRIKSIKG
ncbi:50S ribosomal protein L21 [Candidatus Terasakiella magnetica]|uniref:Large ribosomal subunit protein bL21 n=1 Tax=Candidatus Terasakiella magnetica TaxID=1867952 RepID=A0A1C3REE8_9PROT|nr:50S ribosomal protein L21 [Candidatus Terasakiella magnetica]SCA55670.1 50S ribosomal protein L21 [Candidatus Terasakiella magnetica]